MQAFESLAHIHAFGGDEDLCRGTESEHLRAFDNPNQPAQFRFVETPGTFKAPPINQNNDKSGRWFILTWRFFFDCHFHQAGLSRLLPSPVIQSRNWDVHALAERAPRQPAAFELFDDLPALFGTPLLLHASSSA